MKVEWSVADMLKDNLDWYRKYHSDEGTTFLSTINGLVITQNNSKVSGVTNEDDEYSLGLAWANIIVWHQNIPTAMTLMRA